MLGGQLGAQRSYLADGPMLGETEAGGEPMRVWASCSPALLGAVSFKEAVRCSWARGQEVKDIGLPRPSIPGGLRHPKHIALPALGLPTSPHTHPAFYSQKIRLGPALR